MLKLLKWSSAAALVAVFVSCGIQGCKKQERIKVTIDGSSTVAPISEAMAEEFKKENPKVNVPVATSGTGGGFKKFVLGETDINDASRPIKQKEIDLCKKNDIEYLELKVAIDGLSVVVNKNNTWCNALTVKQLKKLWEPGSKVKSWKELDDSFPDKPFKLYGPDTDSGTFDYFTEVICGKSKLSRKDYEPSVNDNVLVTGVAGDEGALGYFGYAYYIKNKDKLKIVPISNTDDPKDAVTPTAENIETGKYTPLSRPLFLYVNTASLKRKEVADFLTYYLSEQGQKIVGETGYVQLSATIVAETRKKLADAIKAAGGSK